MTKLARMLPDLRVRVEGELQHDIIGRTPALIPATFNIPYTVELPPIIVDDLFHHNAALRLSPTAASALTTTYGLPLSIFHIP